MSKRFRLDRGVTVIVHDTAAEKFGRQYTAGMKGDYRDGGPSGPDQRNSDRFHELYTQKSIRSGFAGSGESTYTNKKTGEAFSVTRVANGSGFHGTDHIVDIIDSEKVGETSMDKHIVAPRKDRVKESDDAKYRVTAKSSDDDSVFKSGIKSKAQADTTAAKMKKAKRKDGAPMYHGVKVVPESKKTIKEGVLDDQDDDGFMAKRQLYDLAKYSIKLHRMIQDGDNLEPWIQAKITKAADYIDSVKHYLEYQQVSGAGDIADQIGMDDMSGIDDMDGMDQTLGAIGPDMPQEEVMEIDQNEDTVDAQTIIGWASEYGVISPEMADWPTPEIEGIAGEIVDLHFVNGFTTPTDVDRINFVLAEFHAMMAADGIEADGPNAHLYSDGYQGSGIQMESDISARRIYERMMKGLKGKR